MKYKFEKIYPRTIFVLLYSDHSYVIDSPQRSGFTAQQTYEKKTTNSFATKTPVACEICR